MSVSNSNALPFEADYSAIENAVMETERGRWFLAEYAHRHRATDTENVLAAIARLEILAALVPGEAGSPDGIRDDQQLRSGLNAIRRIADKIHEVSGEMRRTPAGAIHADTLDLCCDDILAAADIAEGGSARIDRPAAGVRDVAGAGSVDASSPTAASLAPANGAEDGTTENQPLAAPARSRPVLFFVR